jgi:hypothetical protein
MINGNQYAWEDVEVVLKGRPLIGVIAVDYETETEKKNIYGRGKKAQYRGRGRESNTATITVLQSELEALQRTLKKGQKLTDIEPFDVVVSYASKRGGAITTDVIKDCEFIKVKKAIKEGDPNMEIPLELIVGDIEYNV